MKNFSATKYSLQNVTTGRIFEDEGWLLDDPEGGSPSLIRARYTTRQIEPGGDEMGIYRFAQWLPVGRMLKGSCAPVTYKSSKLAAALGLKNLYITFNGYYPKIGAHMSTCSFKETEAYSVCGRLGEDHAHKVLVVASAGNTARAFGARLLRQPHSAAAERTGRQPRCTLVRRPAQRLCQTDRGA